MLMKTALRASVRIPPPNLRDPQTINPLLREKSTEIRVVKGYSVMDILRDAGTPEFSEGRYEGNPARDYHEAQDAQTKYLLDLIGCREGSRILEIGCGNGFTLEGIRDRGAVGVGHTISPEQVKFCRAKGLDVHLFDYRMIGDIWNGKFDSVILRGPLEHFVQVLDVIEGRSSALYQELFEILHRLLDPQSESAQVINTTIHFRNAPNLKDLLKNPFLFRWGSEKYHWTLINKGFGGWYPAEGELEEAAKPYFNLQRQDDITEDYHLTSEEWLKQWYKSVRTKPKIWGRLLKSGILRPALTFYLTFGVLGAQSWNWQFRPLRGGEPPTVHYLQLLKRQAA